MIVNCHEKNCLSSIDIVGPLSSDFKYTCRNHTAIDDNGVHFQDCQFDRAIGSGTDPKAYEHGAYRVRLSERRQSSTSLPKGLPLAFKKRLTERAKKDLIGHPKAEEILKVLQKDIRDSNSGVDSAGE